jgi:hypothetical protein
VTYFFVYVPAGALGVRRRTFVRNCVVSWFLLCTVAMASGAQSSAPGMYTRLFLDFLNVEMLVSTYQLELYR